MRRIIQKLAVLAVLPVASLWSQSWCDCGDWSIGADLLIWTHTDCDFAYASRAENVLDPLFQTSPIVPPPGITVNLADFSREYVKPGYEPGVRVHGRYETACSSFQLSYLWLELNDSRTTRSEPLQFGPPAGILVGETQYVTNNPYDAANGQATSISGRIRSRYQNINLEAGRELATCCCATINLYGNLRWVDIDHCRSTPAVIPEMFNFGAPFPLPLEPTPGGPNFDFRWDTKFWGVGLGGGFSADVELCCGLHAGGRVGAMGLIGEQEMLASGSTALFLVGPTGGRATNRFQVPSRTCFIPAIDVALGVGYQRECECFNIGIDLVYELHYYPAALSWRGGVSQTFGGPGTQTADTFVAGNIGYGGPSIQFTVGY